MTLLFKVFIALSFLLSANTELSAHNQHGSYIEKNGETTKNVKTQPYNIISIAGPMEVYLEKGTEGNIQVTADASLQDQIVVESDGETLTISLKNNISMRNVGKIKIVVPFEDVSEISLKGSGSVESNDMLKGNAMSLYMLGSGKINVNVEANTLDAKLNGSGVIQISGAAKDMDVKTTGSGNFLGKELIAENVRVYISGSGDSTVYAKSSLKARVQGSGNVHYLGNPSANDVKVIGSGNVTPM